MKIKFISIFAIFLSSAVVWATDETPKDSIYQLQGNWKNQESKSIKLKDFSGKPVIIAMTYTGCQYSCPMTINKLLSIEKDLKKAGVTKYQLVIASFDWEKDTPKVLKAYIEKKKLPPATWTFLSATSDQEVRELSVILGINYQKTEGGDFSHSNEINLLDSQGRSIFKIKGVNSEHAELVEKLIQNEKQNK